jgi:hypothetical protein
MRLWRRVGLILVIGLLALLVWASLSGLVREVTRFRRVLLGWSRVIRIEIAVELDAPAGETG